jgi:putative ABC transport system permease protein
LEVCLYEFNFLQFINSKKISMFTNYFKIAWRNLFRNKLHTVINIGGLIIGFTIGVLILLTIYSQLSYDNFHANGKSLYQAYQIYNKKTGEDIGSNFGFPAAPVFKAEAPAIERASRFMYGGNNVVYKEKELKIPIMLVDEDFLSMFTFPVVNGNKVNPLRNLTDIVITEDAAQKIFGNEDPIGKAIKASAGGTLQSMIVSAVVTNFPPNSTIRFDMLARVENRNDYGKDKNNWDSRHHSVYVQLKEGISRQLAEKQLREINRKYLPNAYSDISSGAVRDQQGDFFSTRLMPFRDVHFAPRVNGRATNKIAIYAVLTVGLLIILIACFNFVNINLAKAFTRSKEIAVRKCLGAPKGKLFLQLWSESFLVCLIAFMISVVLVNIFIHPSNAWFKVNTQFSTIVQQPDFWMLAVSLLLFVSLIAGGYPSWMMAKFQVVETLKGKVSLKRKSTLRDSLVVAQFVIACIMISCTYIIYQQFQHLQQAPLGFNKDYLISIPLNKPDRGRELIEKLRARFASNPHIISITGSNINIGRGRDGTYSKATTTFDYKDRSITTNIATVDYDYLKTFSLRIIEGRDFNRSFGTDTVNNVLISESVARQFNEKDLVGKTIQVDSASPRWNIIGIFPDFHLYSMRERLEPLTLIMDKGAGMNYCLIKTSSQNLIAGMESIKKEMASLEPGQEFRGSFVDENIRKWYEDERTMSVLFSIAAMVAIILSCTGLLAMVLLIVQQRVKEIGVRKVLGASVQNISMLISKDFLRLVFIAVLISTPIAWLLMSKWLESFPYRIELQWWMFVLVALTALIIALLTISVNTIRAAMQNPVKSLRTE